MGGNVTVRLNLNSAGYSASLAQAQRSMQSFTNATRQMGHGTVSEMQAASAAIRTLEGGMTNSIRAAERFVSTIPGVGKALQAAFPVIGGIAFAGVIARIGEEAYKTAHQLGQIRNVANESFSALTDGARKNADSLRVTNDKLEQQIAQLEHKPVNNLALALDEARLRADDLAISLDRDYQQFKKIIEETQKGALSTLLNKGVDATLGNNMEDQLANIRTLARQQRDELKAGNQAAADDLGTKLRAAQEQALNFANSETVKRNGIANAGTVRQAPYATVYGNQGQNFDAINAFKDLISGQVDTADEQKRNTADTAKSRALEAANKAQALLLQQMQEGMAKQKALYGVSVADELAYWSARINAFSRGGEQYHTVQMEQYRLQAELYQKLMEGKKKYLEDARSTVEGNDLLSNGQRALITGPAIEAAERATKANEKYNQIAAAMAEIQAKNTAAFRESSIAIGLQEGTISKLAAAQELGKIHADEHAAALARVNEELRTQIDLIKSDPSLKGESGELAIRNAQAGAANQTADINGAYAVTQQRDAANIYQSTGSGEAADMYRTMLQNWSDMTANIAQAMVRAADSLNDDLAKLITGQGKKGDFGKTLTQAGESLVKTGLAGHRRARPQGARAGRQGRQAGWYEGQSDLHVNHHRGRHYSWRCPGTVKRRRTAGFVGKGGERPFRRIGRGHRGCRSQCRFCLARLEPDGRSCRRRRQRSSAWGLGGLGGALGPGLSEGSPPYSAFRERDAAGAALRTLCSLFCPC